MPEAPDLEAYAAYVRRHLLGRRVTEARAIVPPVVKSGRELLPDLVGRALVDASRLGKQLRLDFEGGPALLLHPMLTGRLQHLPHDAPRQPRIALVLTFDDSSDLRLRVLAGPRGSTVLDDSYNASPASVLAALDLLAETPGRRIALLGDMLELGEAALDGHRQVGAHAARTTDVLLVLGEMASVVAEAARAAGHSDVRLPADKEEATAMLARELGPGDYLLVKASRALALETVVEALTR